MTEEALGVNGEERRDGRRRRGRRGRGGARAMEGNGNEGMAGSPLDEGEAPAPLVSAEFSETIVDVAAIPLQVSASPALEEPEADIPRERFASPQPAPAAPRQDASPLPVTARAPVEHTPPRSAPELPPVQLTLPADSNLELVETRFAAVEPVAEEPQQRPKRTRPPKVVIEDAPLQMVETRNEESDKPSA